MQSNEIIRQYYGEPSLPIRKTKKIKIKNKINKKNFFIQKKKTDRKLPWPMNAKSDTLYITK